MMTKINNLCELSIVISNKYDLFEEVRGSKFKVDFVRLMQSTLIVIVRMIEDGKLFYQKNN